MTSSTFINIYKKKKPVFYSINGNNVAGVINTVGYVWLWKMIALTVRQLSWTFQGKGIREW